MKHKLLTALLATASAICFCIGLSACGDNGGANGTVEGGNNTSGEHEHVYTAENKCGICGKEWEYTKTDSYEFKKVTVNGVDGYDVRFGLRREYQTDEFGMYDFTKEPITVCPAFTQEEIVLPYGYNGLPVLSVGAAQTECVSDTVKKIVVPESVVALGIVSNGAMLPRGVFAYCTALEVLVLPKGLSAEPIDVWYTDSASGNDGSLRLHYITSGVSYETLFVHPAIQTDCPLLKNFEQSSEDVLYIGDYAIKCKESATGNITVREGTTAITAYAFSSCGISGITIPSSVTSIGDCAFEWCRNLASITIPNSVTSVGFNAFHDTAYYNDTNNWDVSGALYIGNHLISAYNLNSYGVHMHEVSGAYSIREGTKTIAGGAFAECYELTSITIPSSVTSIGARAFSVCSGLTNITIPSSVTSIGARAFSACSGLTNITIPSSMTSIGGEAFYNCYGLTSITIPDSVTSIGARAFSACSGLTNITIPSSVTSIGYQAFESCIGLKNITIPNSVTSIGYYAFHACKELNSIQFNGTVEEWQMIDKKIGWDDLNGSFDSELYDYTITCTNGTIAKDGTVTLA